MKRLLASALTLGTSVALAAAGFTVTDVNEKIAEIAKPYNTATSVMKFEFTKLAIDAVRTINFGFTTESALTGGKRDVKLTSALTYEYLTLPSGPSPEFNAEIGLEVSMIDLLGQDQINEYGDNLEIVLTSLVSEYTRKYGDALTLNANVTDLQKDAAGNVLSAAVEVDAVIDLARLPSGVQIEDVEFKSVRLTLALNFTGCKITANGILNPYYRGFKEDEVGLKEFIEKLLANDEATFRQVEGLISTHSWLVNLLAN